MLTNGTHAVYKQLFWRCTLSGCHSSVCTLRLHPHAVFWLEWGNNSSTKFGNISSESMGNRSQGFVKQLCFKLGTSNGACVMGMGPRPPILMHIFWPSQTLGTCFEVQMHYYIIIYWLICIYYKHNFVDTAAVVKQRNLFWSQFPLITGGTSCQITVKNRKVLYWCMITLKQSNIVMSWG